MKYQLSRDPDFTPETISGVNDVQISIGNIIFYDGAQKAIAIVPNHYEVIRVPELASIHGSSSTLVDKLAEAIGEYVALVIPKEQDRPNLDELKGYFNTQYQWLQSDGVIPGGVSIPEMVKVFEYINKNWTAEQWYTLKSEARSYESKVSEAHDDDCPF